MEELCDFIFKWRANYCQNIKIKEQIRIWRSSHETRNTNCPEIIIDLESFRDVFAQRDQIGILLGGRYQNYNILFERFVKEIISSDVKLHFFAAVHEFTDQVDLFIPKMEMEYDNHIQQMDKQISDLKNYNQHAKHPSVPPTIEYNLISMIKKLCPKNSIHYNYYRNRQEMIQYANSHSDDILAIISNDLQLLLFDGSFQYWYANDINFKTLNITAINRNTLQLSLGLNTEQLQLLSVLTGSSYLPTFIVDKFISNRQIHASNKVETLATFIKQKTMESYINLNQIADEFDLNQSFASKNEICNAIENGLNCFDINFSTKTLCNDPFKQFSKERNSFIYTLMVDNVFLIKDIAFIDYRLNGDQFPNLVIPLLQKMLGILFKNDLIKPMDRKICMKFAHDEPFRIVKIPIIYPNVSFPQIFDLIFKNRERKYTSKRWSLLEWLMELDSKFCEQLKLLPNKYIAVVLTIHYLLQKCAITDLHADTILYCEYKTREKYQHEMPTSIPYPNLIQKEYILIAHLYTKIFVLINRCLEVCGLNLQMELIRFDGPFFCMTLEKFVKLQTIDLDAKLSNIQNIRIYSTNQN